MANREREQMLEEAWRARESGKQAYMARSKRDNPFSIGSFNAYCWTAGFRQDVRSIDQLEADYRKATQ